MNVAKGRKGKAVRPPAAKGKGKAAGQPLAGKVALVTGAGSGLGRAIALRFVRAGARVALMGRRAERLQETLALVAKAGGKGVVTAGDTRGENDCRWAVEKAVGSFGGLDILVNAAGVFGMGGLETPPAEWDRLMETNVRAMFLMTRAAVPAIARRGRGAVVNLSSTAGGVRPFPSVMPYCVSKAAVEMFTKCVALELAPKGIRVNAIAPGVVPTDLHRAGGMSEGDYAAFLERSATLHPLGFNGDPADIAEAALYLAGPSGRWITGVTLVLDGGRTLVSPR